MTERSNARLVVLAVLLLSLLGTLLARLFYLQIVDAESFVSAARANAGREIVTPAVRGMILDQAGRPLVSNRSSLVVTVDRSVLARQPDKGADVVTRLALQLGMTADELAGRLKDCGTEGAPRPPLCWNGQAYQPVTVAKDVSEAIAVRIMERRETFPGVDTRLEAIRTYPTPWGANAAHLLGYLGPVTEEQLQEQGASTDPARLRRTDIVGRTGLEAQYDAYLRGVPAITQLAVDAAGRVTGTIGDIPSRPGDYLVTTVDAHLQSVVEDQLRAAIRRANDAGNPADSGAAVVVDVRTGGILAMASEPTFDPTMWVGGISTADYDALRKSNALTSLAFQGTFAPGSTFKPVSTAAAAKAGFDLNGSYECPSEYRAGNRTFRNFESNAYGIIPLSRALEVSCNTVFYGMAERMWAQQGGLSAGSDASDVLAATAKRFGLGAATGVDLPGESAGRVAGRAFKQELWDQKKDAWCASAEAGYPETRKTDPQLADYLTQVDRENCLEGYQWRLGDALNASIGQGDTVVTPLQMAMLYSAIANGGTLWQPHIAKAVLSASGDVVTTIEPTVARDLSSDSRAIRFLQAALPGVASEGSAQGAFRGFPLDEIPIAAKTGSAQVFGTSVSTSWLATYAPADDPRYVVLMMVPEGGTGAETSGPSVRAIYEQLFGVSGSTIDPSASVLVGGSPRSDLPTVGADGVPVFPEGRQLPVRLTPPAEEVRRP